MLLLNHDTRRNARIFFEYRKIIFGGAIMPEFKTIRQTAAAGITSEHYLRLLVAQGRCPGIRSGNRFLVNVSALCEMLDEESRRAVVQR